MARRQAIPLLFWLSVVVCMAMPAAAENLTRASARALPRRADNSIEIANQSRSPIRNYPFQFGRPFLRGVVPAGQCPQVLIASRPGEPEAAPSQADVKNTYPDGSVKFAVMAAVIPIIPARGTVVLSFAAGACRNRPLTKAQMLAANFNFDADIALANSAALYGGPPSQAAANIAAWTAITNGGFSVAVNGRTYRLAGLDFAGQKSLGGVAKAIDTALAAARAPATLAYVAGANSNKMPGNAGQSFFSHFVLATTGFTGKETIAPASAPASGADISGMLGLGGGGRVAQGGVQTVSARTMLQNGDYRLWTAGPVAQTVILADDSPARKYDIGFGDGYHPFRPRFYATFWPATNQVSIRAVGENDTISELEDIAYKLSISAGQKSPSVVYRADLSGTQARKPKRQWAMSSWSRNFWLGGMPPPEVDIDHNLGYLAATRFLPNYDVSITVPQTAVDSFYALWTGRPHDLYDGTWDGGLWQTGMSTPGARPEIAPYPQWSVMWMYTGDWRMRDMSLGMADLAGAFPAQLRESVMGKRLSRADPAGSNTGFGHTVSTADRKTLVVQNIGYAYTTAADAPRVVGPLDFSQPWTFDGAHQPAPFYVPYILTGDPWYLNEMYLWAGFSAARYNGADPEAADGRGPTGAEGGINDELRGAGWVLRSRAEIAFAAPDADPEKAFFTYLTNDALARWEGSLGITGTGYDGAAVKNWGRSTGDFYTNNGGPMSGRAPPLGNLESLGYPNGKDSTITENTGGGTFAAGVGSFTSPWMEWYTQYGFGRAEELGFAADPLRAHIGAYLSGMINQSGYPKLIGMYQMPTEMNCVNGSSCTAPPGGFYATWPALVAAIARPFLTGTGWNPAGNGRAGDLPRYFAANLNDDGRPIYAMGGLAMMVDHGDPGAAQAWRWFMPNVYRAIPAGSLQFDPKWAIVPRTDANTLPPQPTATPSAAGAT
jgi:hypothetical protein